MVATKTIRIILHINSEFVLKAAFILFNIISPLFKIRSVYWVFNLSAGVRMLRQWKSSDNLPVSLHSRGHHKF